MLLTFAILLLSAAVLYCYWPHRCPANDPLCKPHAPCMGCWKDGVRAAQEGLAAPTRTQERKIKEEKPMLVRRKG